LAFTAQQTPVVAYALGHRQDSVDKQWKEVLFKPLFQLRAPLAERKNREPSAMLSHGDDAHVQESIVLRQPNRLPEYPAWAW
jgi:hypothetical protein